MPYRHLHFDESAYRRIIAISDIHGGAELFDKLLAQLALQPDDLLVLMGDYVNKGPNSLAVLRRVMALAKRPNTVILAGNHEYFVRYLIRHPSRRAKLIDFLQQWHYHTILHEMCRELVEEGVALAADSAALCDQLYAAYQTEFEFMENLAILLEGESHIFVHAGYESHYELPNDYDGYVKYDDYASLTGYQAKTVVVGHWPISNMLDDRQSNLPYYYRAKNIYFIDGGLNLKTSGELNAFIVQRRADHYHYAYRQVNNFKKAVVIAAVKFPTEPLVHVKYPDYGVELVAAGSRLSRYFYRATGRELSVFNCLVKQNSAGQLNLALDYLNAFLNAPLGSAVEVVKRFEDCSLVKYGDCFYWAENSQLELIE